MNREEWEEENERMARLINDGRFLTAAQGLEIGRMVSEGFAAGIAKGMESKRVVDNGEK